jgi:hypothetical protein
MSLLAIFTMPTGDGGVDRHALTVFGYAGELMSQYKRVFQLCVTNRTLREPVQIRTAHTHRSNMNKLLSLPSRRDRFIMDL